MWLSDVFLMVFEQKKSVSGFGYTWDLLKNTEYHQT